MNWPSHQVAKGFINQSVARDSIQSGKAGGNNCEAKMPPSACSPRMTCMLAAFIFQIQTVGRQNLQPAQYLFAGVHGSTFLNGFTLMLAYTPVAI